MSCLHLCIFVQCSESCCIIRDILVLPFVLRNCDIGLLRVALGGVVKIRLILFLVVLSFFTHATTCSPPVSSCSTYIYC